MVNKWKVTAFVLMLAIFFYIILGGLLTMVVFFMDYPTIPEKSQHLVEWALSHGVSPVGIVLFVLSGLYSIFLFCFFGAWYLTDIMFWKNENWKTEKEYLLGAWKNWHPFGVFKKKVVD